MESEDSDGQPIWFRSLSSRKATPSQAPVKGHKPLPQTPNSHCLVMTEIHFGLGPASKGFHLSPRPGSWDLKQEERMSRRQELCISPSLAHPALLGPECPHCSQDSMPPCCKAVNCLMRCISLAPLTLAPASLA